jgi:hypothetical protein
VRRVDHDRQVALVVKVGNRRQWQREPFARPVVSASQAEGTSTPRFHQGGRRVKAHPIKT